MYTIGHFRLPFASVSKRVFVWKWVSPARPFSCKSNSFSYEWFHTGTRFENEAKVNSKMAYYLSFLLRIWIWRLKQSFVGLGKLASDLYNRVMGQQPGFLACLCDDGNDERPTDYLLILSCFPIHLKYRVNSHISSTYFVNFQGEGTSIPPLCVKDQVFVSLSEAFLVQQRGTPEDLYLM